MTERPIIAFCTTCKGRVQHLRETLPRNLADNAGYPKCKFIVLDYGDPGEVRSYLQDRHGADIVSGQVVAFRFDSAGPFHVSHAKNIAARCGILEGADILVTLDADNFTGAGFAEYVAQYFINERANRPGILLCPDFPLIHSLPHGPDRPARGYAGRLALRTQDFIKMGGYDESFDTWHGEDTDMIARLQKLGYHFRHISNRFLNAIPHNAEVRFKEYPQARQFEDKREVKAIYSRAETVVNFGRFGLGEVYRNFSQTPIELTPVPTRIFGVGLQKTGTTSFDKACQILGYDSLHWGTGEAPKIWQEMQDGRSKTLEQFYALSDLPIPLLYEKLDRAYPGSKFILTIRDEAGWIKSVERLWDARYNPTRWMWDVYPFTHHIHTVLYGQQTFDVEVFLKRYRQHNAELKRYFRDRTADLLIMDMSTGAGWPELCGFLGVPIPATPYPTSNSTQANFEAIAQTRQITTRKIDTGWLEAPYCEEPEPKGDTMYKLSLWESFIMGAALSFLEALQTQTKNTAEIAAIQAAAAFLQRLLNGNVSIT